MDKRIFWLWVPLILILGTPLWAGKEVKELRDIPLEWKPTKDLRTFPAVDLTVFQKATLAVKPFKDLRKKPSEIGVNVDKRFSDRELTVTTKDNVAEWLTYHFSRTLSNFDIQVNSEKANFFLEGDILKFLVVEESLYRAEVALKIRLLSKTNKILWEGMISGLNTRLGKSYLAVNYHETLSDAVLSAVHALLQQEAFKEAILKGETGARI